MASVFRQVFGCCIRSRSPSSEEPNESTPFIQPSDEVPPVRTYTVDHDRLKERLGTIVRSKEGKMVNVNQPLPFNLHGRHPHARPDRSLSANTTPPRASSSNAQADPAPESSAAAANRHGPRLPSYSPSREPSPSIQTSHSTSSLHPGDASYLPPEADPDGVNRRPILNVRLIRRSGGFSTGGRPHAEHAVVRGRTGRREEEHGQENTAEEEGSGSMKGKGVASGMNGTSDATSVAGETSHAGSSEAAASSGTGVGAQERSRITAQNQEPTMVDCDFQADDVGNIAESWGD
ncbi:hypothetical protein BV20DRAFT_473346 [Pilatotrama ljubarskyi]|nr:hypothetical protein BV20DRAFT_473346 [Pilatotrama ljubarskyi]